VSMRALVPILRRLPLAAVALATAVVSPTLLTAQLPVACDFDIADNLGRNTYGNTVHLVGTPGRGTSSAQATSPGQFYLINSNTPESDVDKDGYSTACIFRSIYVASKTNLVNVANPALAIPGQNIVITKLPDSLATGASAQVNVQVEIPGGTVAGTYVGQIEIRDRNILTQLNSSGDVLNLDVINVEVRVLEQRSLALVDADSAAQLDSVVLRGRAGQTATGVLRVANTGNAPLADVRLTASDLRSESAVGLVIPRENISFADPGFANVGTGDTARVTISVRIPRGILGGRYRGTLSVQGGDAETQTIPLIVIVTSARGILFANNPVRGALGDIGQIAFNGDPGTIWSLAIFDMMGLVVYKAGGTVFAGVGSGGTPGTVNNPELGADFAVNVLWNLTNGRGEPVASGMYLVVVQSFVNGQRQLARDRLMVIR
jgi:hypothetical protein